MTVEQSYQQSLAAEFGEARAEQACLPTCFYMLARAYGYLTDTSLIEFVRQLNLEQSYEPGHGWLRAPLSQRLRELYGLPIVSWMVNQPPNANFELMVDAGYLTTQREIAWFEQNVVSWPLDVVIAAGSPAIVTMKPGFGTNNSLHAVVLAELKNDHYEVIDPDERNLGHKRFYSIDEIHAGMAETGAASIILPPT